MYIHIKYQCNRVYEYYLKVMSNIFCIVQLTKRQNYARKYEECSILPIFGILKYQCNRVYERVACLEAACYNRYKCGTIDLCWLLSMFLFLANI